MPSIIVAAVVTISPAAAQRLDTSDPEKFAKLTKSVTDFGRMIGLSDRAVFLCRSEGYGVKDLSETQPEMMREMQLMVNHPQLKDYYQLGYRYGMQATNHVVATKGLANACREFQTMTSK